VAFRLYVAKIDQRLTSTRSSPREATGARFQKIFQKKKNPGAHQLSARSTSVPHLRPHHATFSALSTVLYLLAFTVVQAKKSEPRCLFAI